MGLRNLITRMKKLVTGDTSQQAPVINRVLRRGKPHKANPRQMRPWLRASLGRIRDKNVRPRFPKWARAHFHGWKGHSHA
jgi:hypothetical protein